MTRGLGVLASCLTLVASTQALAYRDGKQGALYTGKIAGLDCKSCHGDQGQTPPTVTVKPPDTLAMGTAAQFTVTIAGGPGTVGGIAIDAEGATLEPGTNLVKATNPATAIVHGAAPVTYTGGNATFAFTATPTAATVVLYVAGASGTADMLQTTDRAADPIKMELTVGAGNPPPGNPPPGNEPPPSTGGPDAGVGGGPPPSGSGVEGYLNFGCNAAAGLPIPLLLGALTFALSRRRSRSK